MRYRIASTVLALSAFAAGAAQASDLPKRTSVTLHKATWVGATVVPAGTYRVELGDDAGTARFIQGRHTVAEAPVRVGLERAVYAGTALHTRTLEGQERLVKIVLAPSGLALDFTGQAVAASPASVATSADRP